MDSAYRRVADDLRADITSGRYRPGDPIPSENFLVGQYNLSRTTIRAALGQLKAEGLIDAGPGRPTVVREQLPRIRVDGSQRYLWEKQQVAQGGLPSDSHLAREVGLAPDATELKLLVDEEIVAGRDIGAALGVPAEQVIRHYTWLLSTGGQPGRLAHHYYTHALDAAVRAWHPGNVVVDGPSVLWRGGTFYNLAQQGIEVRRVQELVTARMPLGDEADLLRLPEGVPLLVKRKVTLDTELNVREVVDVLMPADRTELSYQIDLPLWAGGVAGLGDSDGE